MLEFLIDNIFVMFGGCVLQDSRHTNWYKLCSFCADLFLYSYEVYFIQGLLKKNGKKLAGSFNFTFRYIDYVRSLRLVVLLIESLPVRLK